MNDLTLIYITANKMSDKWMDYHIEQLNRATHKLFLPIISISREPMDLGENYLDTDKHGYWNIYRQLLRGAKLATTKYVATVEDDTLYSREHFKEFRPKDDEVSYNHSRWSLFSWDAVFCLRQRISNCSLIAPRELLIEALDERMAKHPDGDNLPNPHIGEVGRHSIELRLKVTRRKKVEWWSTTPVIQLNHPDGIDGCQQKKRKAHGQLKANEIPYWGKATDIVRIYNECIGIDK